MAQRIDGFKLFVPRRVLRTARGSQGLLKNPSYGRASLSSNGLPQGQVATCPCRITAPVRNHSPFEGLASRGFFNKSDPPHPYHHKKT